MKKNINVHFNFLHSTWMTWVHGHNGYITDVDIEQGGYHKYVEQPSMKIPRFVKIRVLGREQKV